MSWTVSVVAHDDLEQVWPIAAPMLAAAVVRSEGRYNMHALFTSLQGKRALLWIVYDARQHVHAAFTTREAQYPCARWLSVDFLGGSGIDRWLTIVCTTLDDYARAADLEGVEMVGRPGWVKPLAASGWRQNAVMLVKTGSAVRDKAA